MASIFTFDPDPPRVASPWSTPPPGSQSRHSIPQNSASGPVRPSVERLRANSNSNTPAVDYSAITRLEAEPQEGPTEYKLHLLLRQRRSFTRSSTGQLSGSLRRTETPTFSSLHRSVSEPETPPPLPAMQSRQHRLEQLTTQLLWRLQQSCPYHESSSTALVLPHFPNELQLAAPAAPQQLLPGLEESKGALYEIGVADDGTFVGLAHDEMEESLNNLRAMAASLGCHVDVLRMVSVGECEWVEEIGAHGKTQQKVQTGELWVAEAFVQPEQHSRDRGGARIIQKDVSDISRNPAANIATPTATANDDEQMPTQQLRVSLTGATLSGKSSLLGSLSTSTLDNGRGKSRLSLLKHRHEILSGMTSSVTQELIGYRDVVDQQGARPCAQVISYGAGNVSSWVDIHASAENGRLVFLSDSAGHPRFRRTTVRGLVGWDPHWTLLCVPADNTDDPSGRIGSSPTPNDGQAGTDLDLSHAHLQLCLNLELPLVVIITKYDLATKSTLRQTLSKLLSALKDAGRKPCIISAPSKSVPKADLNTVSPGDLLQATEIIQTLRVSPLDAVPIILTSAVDGTGINKLHAFLRELPLPAIPASPPGTPRTLFYIEDVYSGVATPSKSLSPTYGSSDRAAVIGGHLRYGRINVGDELLLGPYPIDAGFDDSDSGSGRALARNSTIPTSRSFPGALHKTQSGKHPSLRSGAFIHEKDAEWRRVRITSLRNLRLPVRTLYAGQVGTMGVVPMDLPIASPAVVRIRKGMVLQSGEAKANRVLSVRFSGANTAAVKSLTVGSAVVIYVASVRASAKVVSVATESASHDSVNLAPSLSDDDEDYGAFGFGFEDETASSGGSTELPKAGATIVTFQFIASREFVEMDAKVLVLPGGGPVISGGTERGEKGVAGLEGFVGRVLEGYG